MPDVSSVVLVKDEQTDFAKFKPCNISKIATIDHAALKDLLQGSTTGTCTPSPELTSLVLVAEVKQMPNRKRKRDDVEEGIAQTQREILQEMKIFAAIQADLLDQMKIQNDIER